MALERFEAFNLNGAKVTAAGIVRFVENRTKLQRLELTDVPLRDDDLASLKHLTDLRVMSSEVQWSRAGGRVADFFQIGRVIIFRRRRA